MEVETLIKEIEGLGIDTFAGVPDSLLKELCEYLNSDGIGKFNHYVPANEGAAVAIGAGTYLATGKPACIYMQNSGIGNTVNPIASLINKDVYDIPMLFIVGWRGEPGVKDEPQHVFQGKITGSLFDVMDIKCSIIDDTTTPSKLKEIMDEANVALRNNLQYTIIVRKGTFAKRSFTPFYNDYTLLREDAIHIILGDLLANDRIVSTTGKISREVYEQADIVRGQHDANFLTVGCMGHASSIALGLASADKTKRTVCIDGDGAALMHMGSMAFIAKQAPKNYLHILLNNDVHESVGGMPTGTNGMSYAPIAKACGYPNVYTCTNEEELIKTLNEVNDLNELSFIEVKVKIGSRDNLGRPKETPIQNKENFIKFNKEN
ncbi:MAG: phosphonopyruvate decarboxylase [Erysipelotrichaceae bacterium]